MAICIAFPLGYTCQSGAKLRIMRLTPWEVPNVCLGACAYLSMTWDKERKEHTFERAKRDWQHSLFKS